MAGHVPKFGAHNGGGNFTEDFSMARTGAKAGSGDAAAAAAAEPKRGVASRRVAGSGERDVPEPPRRGSGSSEREGSSGGSSRARGGRGTAARKAPRNVNDEHAASSHLPKFGDWNTADAGEANYTVMFTAASRERQGGSAVELGSKNASSGRGGGGGGGGDVSRSSHGSKKHSPSWWCFS